MDRTMVCVKLRTDSLAWVDEAKSAGLDRSRVLRALFSLGLDPLRSLYRARQLELLTERADRDDSQMTGAC
jgi:hypothetical protein